MESRRLGLEPYMYDRTDMFWADVDIKDEGLEASLTYCIEVNGELSFQYGPKMLNTTEMQKKVLNKWKASPEKDQQDTWVRLLREAGYFDRGNAYAPNANTARCKHCKHWFEIGTSHPHTYLPNEFSGRKKGSRREIIYHHKLMEKEIKAKGLKRIGVSGLPDIPSLEDEGKLVPYIIGSEDIPRW